jgi:hypothetical protein
VIATTALHGPLALATRIVHVVAFLLFDREAGGVRPSALSGLGVVALTVVCHLWLSGPWLERAGFPAVTHMSIAAAPSPATAASCNEGASRP